MISQAQNDLLRKFIGYNMQYNYESYLEKMQGVILEHNYDGSYHSTLDNYILKILVNHPFNAEISIRMNTDTWNEYVNYSLDRKWRGFLDSHPEAHNSMEFYCNRQEGRFYMASSTDDKDYPVWEETTLTKIITISRSAWIFSRHRHIDYNRFHAGQTCEFYAYATDDNERLYKPSTIDENFSKYTWIYNPLTFTVHEITSESIEHLIAKTPIPKPVLDKIILDRIQEYQHSKTNGRNIDDLVAETPPSKSATLEILQQYKFEEEQSQRKADQQKWIKKKKSLIKLKDWLIESKTITALITGLLTGSGGLYAILKWIIPFFQK